MRPLHALLCTPLRIRLASLAPLVESGICPPSRNPWSGNLVDALVPGGVLQLATYSTLGIRAWWEPTRRLVHKLAPSIVNAAGQVLRQPAPHELREQRG